MVGNINQAPKVGAKNTLTQHQDFQNIDFDALLIEQYNNFLAPFIKPESDLTDGDMALLESLINILENNPDIFEDGGSISKKGAKLSKKTQEALSYGISPALLAALLDSGLSIDDIIHQKDAILSLNGFDPKALTELLDAGSSIKEITDKYGLSPEIAEILVASSLDKDQFMKDLEELTKRFNGTDVASETLEVLLVNGITPQQIVEYGDAIKKFAENAEKENSEYDPILLGQDIGFIIDTFKPRPEKLQQKANDGMTAEEIREKDTRKFMKDFDILIKHFDNTVSPDTLETLLLAGHSVNDIKKFAESAPADYDLRH